MIGAEGGEKEEEVALNSSELRHESPSHFDLLLLLLFAPSTSKPASTLRPVLTSAPTTAQSSRTSSTFSASSFQTTNQSQQQQTETTAGASATDVLLYVGLTLAVTVILLLLGLLILCRKRANKTKEPPADTVYANVSVANRVYEEIREEDRRQISSCGSVYSLRSGQIHQTKQS
ncbi:uncharacterized protein AKAME5_000374100 [Lates japonicus]|uniref:Uncharacterized protein n=1 Tax=Lates japonicus TaxID=270547 RepID=A0AAD3MA63_LATJO|nr:uncharacterized protein AKAME5_000374100 [Lates japonicus]